MKHLILIAMYLLVTCSVSIGGIDLGQKVSAIEVNSSWQTIADTAQVAIPRNITNLEANTFKKGDPVTIRMGYLDRIDEEIFTGYLASKEVSIPYTIYCEDAAWLTRNAYIKKTWKSEVTFKEIMEYLVSETNSQNPGKSIEIGGSIPDLTFTQFRIANNSVYEVLQVFREQYGLAVYFRGNQLYAGLPYQDSPEDAVPFNLDFNQKGIKHSLNWQFEDEARLLVEARGFTRDNKELQVTVGREGGSRITKFYYDVDSEATLTKLAQADLLNQPLTGYRGSFKAFLIPLVRHSWKVNIAENDFPQRQGTYLVDQVRYTLDTQGITQHIQIGGKIRQA